MLFPFVRYGAAEGVPSWVTSLVLAERWGIPPWEVADHESSLLWANRAAALDQARKISADLDKKK